jgi:hypothetical protein
MKLNRRERQQGTRWRHRLSKERRRSEAPEQQQSQKAQDYQAHQARDGASGPKRQLPLFDERRLTLAFRVGSTDHGRTGSSTKAGEELETSNLHRVRRPDLRRRSW